MVWRADTKLASPVRRPRSISRGLAVYVSSDQSFGILSVRTWYLQQP